MITGQEYGFSTVTTLRNCTARRARGSLAEAVFPIGEMNITNRGDSACYEGQKKNETKKFIRVFSIIL